jgi:hypothetical protein
MLVGEPVRGALDDAGSEEQAVKITAVLKD